MKYIFLWISIFLLHPVFSQVTVYFNYAVFNNPNSKPYLETYLTIAGSSVRFAPIGLGYQANVNVSWKISKDKTPIKTSNYNLLSPVVTDTLHHPSFIDNQRFALDNGTYLLELTISDNAFPDKKHHHSENIVIKFNRDKNVYASDIEVLDSYSKADSPNSLSKNGYNLIPYTINYYPKAENILKFYHECYNADTALGKNSKLVYSYYVENSETLGKINGLSGFQKQRSQKVNPILAQFDISQLATGNYNLVIEVKDSTNKIQSQKKWFFQRQSDVVNLASSESNTSSITTIEEFFNHFQSRDSLKDFIQCLWPISGGKERDWQQIQASNKDPNIMRSYLVNYWITAANDTINPLKLWMGYYKEVLEANALLKCGKQKGYYTDRGRVYLQYGKPDQRNQVNSEPNTYPYEIWQYYRIYDKTTKRFFTNKKFVFANFAISDNCYKLIHSDVRGELYDEKWRLRLVGRSQQTQNIDETKPKKTYGTNMDENFENPR